MVARELLINVLGGLLATWVAIAYSRFRAWRRRTRLWEFLGYEVDYRGLAIVYDEHSLRPEFRESAAAASVPNSSHPFHKPELADFVINAHSVCSTADMRAAGAAVASFAPYLSNRISMTRDRAADFDFSTAMLSLGFYSNCITRLILQNEGNIFVRYRPGIQGFWRMGSSEPYVHQYAGFDYGMILKIHPRHSPVLTWIACAGNAEWGTSGAAHFLASNWSSIPNWVDDDGGRLGSRPFVLIVRTRIGTDQLAEPLVMMTAKQSATTFDVLCSVRVPASSWSHGSVAHPGN